MRSRHVDGAVPRLTEKPIKFITTALAIVVVGLMARNSDARMRRSVIMQVLGTYNTTTNFVTHLLEAEPQLGVRPGRGGAGRDGATVEPQCKGDILAGFWGDAVEIDDGA
jgi:hypothetical protein